MDREKLEPWWLADTIHWTSFMFWAAFCGLSCLILLYTHHVRFVRLCFDKLPPGPSTLPLLGNLHQLLKPLPHQALANLAKQHGPLMCLRMGSRLALFISNGAMAKMFFQANDRHFASRPRFAFCDRLLYSQHNGVAFSVYGPRWRKMRTICTLELFTTRRIHSFRKVFEAELALVVSELLVLCDCNNGAVVLNVAHLAHLIVSNMMGCLVLSKRMCDTIVNGESLLDMFKKTNDAIVPAVGDFIPYVGSLLDLKNTCNMDRMHKHIDSFWRAILEDRRKCRASHPETSSMDFLDALLLDEEVVELGDDNIKATLMDILGAGSETSAITIEWAMAELLRSPHCFAKLQMELDAACPPMAASVSPSMSPSSASSAPSLRLPWQNVLSSLSPLPLSSPSSSFLSMVHSWLPSWYPKKQSSSNSPPPPLSSSPSLSSLSSSSNSPPTPLSSSPSSSLSSPTPLSSPPSSSLSSSSTTMPTSMLSSSLSSSLSPSPLIAYAHTTQAHYLKAVLKETLRLHPPVPLLIPRESMGGMSKIVGYTFPANMMLFVNAWAMGRDGEAWEEPEVFRPERFMGCLKEGNDGGSMDLHNNYQMLPFGAGRRRCPGMGLALSIMELTLATLVWAFHWELPDGHVLEMSEKSGNAGTHKAKALIAVIRPRYSPLIHS